MSAKHTPGPWKVAKGKPINGNNNLFEIHYSDDGECVAEIVHEEADARLIAAAPDMLKALQLLPLSEFNRDGDHADAADFVDNSADFIMAMDAARDAIAKATA